MWLRGGLADYWGGGVETQLVLTFVATLWAMLRVTTPTATLHSYSTKELAEPTGGEGRTGRGRFAASTSADEGEIRHQRAFRSIDFLPGDTLVQLRPAMAARSASSL